MSLKSQFDLACQLEEQERGNAISLIVSHRQGFPKTPGQLSLCAAASHCTIIISRVPVNHHQKEDQ